MKRHILIIALIFLSSCAPNFTHIKRGETEYMLEKEIRGDVVIKYLLYLPDNYETSETDWPMILFLHGAGERGANLKKVKLHGPPKRIEEGKKIPFIIVAPQCPSNQRWSVSNLDKLLGVITENYRVDENRIYLTGLSMGGYGTWDLAMEYPNRFAAIAPICGAGDTSRAHVLKDMPIWVFHGAKDDIVPLQKSQDMVDALKTVGSDVKFTIYRTAGHDSWTRTYKSSALYKWFLEHSLNK